MCDELRVENNGKLFIIGMYSPDMSVPQLPFVLPTLTFVFWLECDRPGSYQFNARLAHLESGAVITQAMGGFGINATRPGAVGLLPIRLMGLRFSQAGAHTFSLQFQGEQEIQHHFQLILNVPAMPMLGNPPGQGFPIR